MTLIWNLAPQGTEEWKTARLGVITGSIAHIARETVVVQRATLDKVDKKTGEITLGRPEIRGPSGARKLKARDLARQRLGGTVQEIYTNAAMRLGTSEEDVARQAYEDRTGNMVEQVGFAHTEDRRFGFSADGLIHRPIPSPFKRPLEIKTMVSSDVLFDAAVEGDISAYRDQCLFAMWMLCAEAVELYLHVWDLPELSRIIVIERDEEEIQALEDDMMTFEGEVAANVEKLKRAMGQAPVADTPPWQPSAPEPAAYQPGIPAPAEPAKSAAEPALVFNPFGD